MTLKLKKIGMAILVMFIFTISNYYKVTAVTLDNDTKDFGSKTITDVNKVWKVSFNSEIDMDSLSENIQIKDITSGNTYSPNLVQENNNSIIKISTPLGGYSSGHQYQIILKNNIKSKKGNSLSKTGTFNFTVSSNNTGASNNISNSTNKYNISAKVIVSPVVPIFKEITIVSTDLPGAQKYKIEGNDKPANIGDSQVGVTSGDSMKIYICDAQGNIIGTTDLNVSVTKEDISLLISR